jgi:hypothetical protein
MVKVIAAIVVSFLALVGLGYLMINVVGKPIGTDLSIIGKGKPVLVLVYQNYSPTGGEALNRLSQVMGDYDSRLEFAVANLGVPEGRAFASRYQLADGQAIFLKQDGQPLQVTSIPVDERELRSRLDAKLESVE